MLFSTPGREAVDSLPGAARLRYYAGLLILGILSTPHLLLHFSLFPFPTHISYTPYTPYIAYIPQIPLPLLSLLALYILIPLRSQHTYYTRAAAQGCGPIPSYPSHDYFGLRTLFQTARDLRQNVMLQNRKVVLEEMGHTFSHAVFPEPRDMMITDEAENVRAVLSVKFEDWVLPDIRIRSFLPVLGKHSIFTTNGAEWQHSRSILRPAFVRDQISDLACIDRHVRKLITRIRAADNKGEGKTATVDLQAMFSMMTTDSISDFMLGQSTDLQGSAPEESYKFGRYFDASMQKIAWRARLGWLTLLRSDPELEEYVGFMRDFIAKFVRGVREHPEMSSFRGEGGEGKYVFLDELIKSGESDEVICDHLLSIFTAGRDTTTSVLSYLFFELSRRPNIVARIRQEIQDLKAENPTWEDLRGMKYLNWTLKEALRLNPPVASNTREAVRDTILPRGGGKDGKSPVLVTKGTSLRYMPWVMHRKKDYFGEDAEEFRPERWEDLRVTYEYVPFNAGPRICIGQQFALTQMALITFRLLQAFKAIERRDERPPIQKLGISLSMLYGCLVSFTPA
ncbi:cytochrome P450 52E2 [Xylaria venustula]|nr:cytochrome P450 52E2 [Xylaria venustula]